jgi:transposase InsO family protein
MPFSGLFVPVGFPGRFISIMVNSSFLKLFKAEAKKHGIKLIFARSYNPRGRGKIERYHKTLYLELIVLKEFHSMSHFRKELWRFDRLYNT